VVGEKLAPGFVGTLVTGLRVVGDKVGGVGDSEGDLEGTPEGDFVVGELVVGEAVIKQV
jgi:hypothetical protein